MGAPLNPVPATLRVALEGTAGGRPWANILHGGYSGSAPTNNTLVSFAQNFTSQWAAHVASLCPSPISLTNVVITDLTSTSASQGESPSSTLGTRGDDTIGGNTAVLVTYPSPVRFRGGHPRTYLLCLGNADNASTTQWHPAAATEVTTKWQAFLAAAFGGVTIAGTTISTFGFVRYHGKFQPNSGPPHFYLNTPVYEPLNINAATASQQMASQRRRIGRVKA